MAEKAGSPGLSRTDVLYYAAFGAAYFFSVRASEHLYGSLQVSSPFWLPDSVLLSALLLIPRQHWWTLFLIVWPIRLLAGAPHGTPVWFWISTIAIDSLKALLAGSLLHRFLGRTVRLNTIREYLIFLAVGATAVPLISAIAVAPARHALGDPVGRAVYQWFMGDALAQAIVTPLLLYVGTGAYERLRTRLSELALLFAGLGVVLFYAFVSREGGASLVLLYTPVPFLIWAAIRFGPPATAAAITLVSFVTVFGAANGTDALTRGDSNHDLLSIQLFLMLVAVSLLSLAIVIAERQRRTEELEVLLDAAPITILIATDTDCTNVRTNSTNPLSPLHHAMGALPAQKALLQRAALSGHFVSGAVLTYVSDDGSERHSMGSAAPLIGEDGKPRGAIGAFMDITDRKLAEERVQELTGRLITAQDEERARIARELHDDACQQLVALQMRVEQFRQATDCLSSQDRQQLSAIVKAIGRCGSDLHEVSHGLHPSTLDILALVDTVGGLCRQFRAQHGTNVRFVHRDVPEHLDQAVKVCLVRIAQEALRNVVTHSGVTDATVELSGQDGKIELSITDTGAGFDLDAASKASGLGLVSMRERSRLLGGRFVVESSPLRGTRVHVSVPVSPASQSRA